ncbi:fibronectin type III domain-containing protein [Nocardioides sp. GCM10027113]|uniref:fibronectin type III domain-containing protein n=1 Tax=unclassified Nocardioides TaxID=2615069 RepID=UPI003622E7BB
MRRLLALMLPTALLAGGLAGVSQAGTDDQDPAGDADRATRGARGEVVKVDDARLKFEINDTDGDGGIQLFLDAEQWKWMSLHDPSGRRILKVRTQGIMALQGGTELFMESAEPTFDTLPLDELLERWPAGTYKVRGRGLEGERYRGKARLTHDLPDGPRLLRPVDGAGPQDPDRTVLRWRRVPPPNGSPIIGYQVLVVEPDTGIRALPNITLDVTMPPDANRMRVPRGFLKPDTEYEWEVLAIERGGNQTLSSAEFVTAD